MEIMSSNAEVEFRQFKEAKEDGRLDTDGKPVFVSRRGIPYNYKPSLLLKILKALDNFMFK